MFRRKKMSDEMFDEFMQSVKEAVLIEKGEIKPSRVFEMESLDIAKIRNKTNKTQEEFAAMLNISIGTLRNWEQGRRKPDGAALSLLKIVKADPQYVEKVLLT
ncbi:helix-turn-helix domain-containing protein [Treponema denticola]|uniref:NadS family protein n=1 Tax=Treponema denticola TaxID=158 RepID=UPI0020A38133|nr:NadS family protein [Treponema denticola]UTD07134.1 helix-turn-helix domain-containing protein [Treponema denticola]